jgi:DNA-directed RNA polymerase specialized sigma24 family protein
MNCVRQRLLEPDFRARLSAMVRRRVPAGDAEDVVQSVMCDALAAQGAPANDADAGRFIGGIARNKVADFHRRARRDARADTDVDELGAAPCEPAEARVILGAIAQDPAPRARETLEWIVREHAGEELAEIAKETRLPAPVVRQRVSRMRRALRARWLGCALALALGLGYAGVRWVERAPADIVADPTAAPASAQALARVQGDWQVQGKKARVHIEGAHLVIDAPGLHAERAIEITSVDGDTIHATLHGANATNYVTVTIDPNRLVVRGEGRTYVLVSSRDRRRP